MKTVGQMLQVVTPALDEVLTADELAATSTRVVRQTAGQSPMEWQIRPVRRDEDTLDDRTLLEVRIFDDRCSSWMQGRETPVEMYERFRSELQDFVAESTFGWGELRP